MLFLVIIATCLEVVALQNSTAGRPSTNLAFPPECQNIINNASISSVYPLTSVANVFNTFCPVIDEFTKCIERNLGFLRNSSWPTYKILAENFDRQSLKLKIERSCASLPSIANDLECLKSIDLKSCVQQTNLQRPGLTRNELCSDLDTIDQCYRNIAQPTCPLSVLNFYSSYQYIFVPCNFIPPILVSGGPDSIIIACAEEIYPVFMRQLYASQSIRIAKIVFESFQDMCRNRSAFAKCVKERFVPPLMPLDALVEKVVNPKSIESSLDQLCRLTLSNQEETCLQESSTGMLFCSTALDNYREYKNINNICPGLNYLNKCIGIQIRRCSSSLGQIFENVRKELLTSECKALEASLVLDESPLTSIFGFCGYPLGAEILKQFVDLNGTFGSGDSFIKVIRDLIPVFCGYIPFYSTCIGQELVKSTNTFDRIANKLFDLTDAGRIQRVFTKLCDQTKDIQDNINCIRQQSLNITTACFRNKDYKEMEMLNNISTIDFTKITELCLPAREIGLCAAGLMSNCSTSLATLGQNVYSELLSKDCGGQRPLTGGSQIFHLNHEFYVFALLSFLFR